MTLAKPTCEGALGLAASWCLHWPEYLMETGEVSLYLFFTCLFATLLQHPASPVTHFVAYPIVRRALTGLAVGATLAAIIMSPWGKQSGGHFNPAMTFTFYWLGKVAHWDALFYGAAQFLGATNGIAMATFLLRGSPGNSAVRYAVTAPGAYGLTVAFLAEIGISFLLMITFETPLSGMSMNPARTFGPAVYAGYWHALWIYFVAPTAGMLIGGAVFLIARHGKPPYCAKLYHANNKRCIFHHGEPLKSETTREAKTKNLQDRSV